MSKGNTMGAEWPKKTGLGMGQHAQPWSSIKPECATCWMNSQKTIRWPVICLMLVRRWSNIKTTPGQRLVFSGKTGRKRDDPVQNKLSWFVL